MLTLLQKEKCIKSVCLDVAKEVCEVWKHHFGLRLVCGKDSVGLKRVDNSVKFVVEVHQIAGKIQRLYISWVERLRKIKRKEKGK